MVNPELQIVDGAYKVTPYCNTNNITTNTTTLVKSGAGFLHTITLNKPVATGTIALYDALTATTPFATITVPAGQMVVTLAYDKAFTTGLTIVTATVAQDITVSYI